MKAIGVTEAQLYKVLGVVNRYYGGNIDFKSIVQKKTKNRVMCHFTLRVLNSSEHGAGLSPFQIRNDGGHYRTGNACWDVHGHFFDIAITMFPHVVIISGGLGVRSPNVEYVKPEPIKMYMEDGKIMNNWTEFWRGNNYKGFVRQSELCDCTHRPTIPEDLETPKKSGKIIWIEA